MCATARSRVNDEETPPESESLRGRMFLNDYSDKKAVQFRE